MHYCSLNTIYNVKSSGVKKTIFLQRKGEEWKYKVAEKKIQVPWKLFLKGHYAVLVVTFNIHNLSLLIKIASPKLHNAPLVGVILPGYISLLRLSDI